MTDNPGIKSTGDPPRVLVLDTTYALPLFKIDVDLGAGSRDALQSLWSSGFPGFRVYLPSVCLIECVYKLVRLARTREDPRVLTTYATHLPSVLLSPVVTIFNAWLDPATSEIAMNLRASGHPDLMDCWIAASACALEGILVSEDAPLARAMAGIPATRTTPVWTWTRLTQQLRDGARPANLDA